MSSVAMVYGVEQIPVSMVEQVEVIKGGGSALYGPGSVGGVINIIPARPNHTSAYLVGRYEPMKGLPNSSLSAGGNFVSKDRSTAFTLYGQADRIKPLDLTGDGFTEVAKRDFNALGFRLEQQLLGNSGRLTFDFNRTEEARRGGDLLDLPESEANIAESVQSRRSAAGFSWYHSVSSAFDYRIAISYAYLHRNSYYGAGKDPNAYGSTDSPLWVLDSQINHYLSKHVLSWGGQMTREKLQDVQPAYDRKLDETYTNTGFYLQDDWFFAKGWEVVYGLRIDKHSEIGNPIVSPRAALMWNPKANLKFRGSIANGFRPPQVFDENLHITQVSGEGHVIRNSPALRQERSTTITLGSEWTPPMGSGNALVEFNLFRTGIDDLHKVVEDDDPSTPELEFSRTNFGSARVYGMELNLGYGIAGKYQVEFGYVEQRSHFGQPEPDFGSMDFFRTPNRYGVASFTWKNPRYVDIFLGARFTGSMVVPHYAGWIAEDRLEMTSSYFTLDASVSKAFPLGFSDSNVVISVGGKNLTDAFQADVDQGPRRDSGYVWGPRFPRSIYTSVRFHF
jgi:outer membrane receptor for ferrienterochelin and colicins